MILVIPRINMDSRFQEVRTLVSFIKTQESVMTPPVDSDLVKILRGLFFPHLYGAFEKSINEAVEIFLQAVQGLAVPYCHFAPSFLPTALDPNFQSIYDSVGKRLAKRIDFVRKMESSDRCVINNAAFSRELQNAWPETLAEVARSIGIILPLKSTSTDLLYLYETVDKRNAVAHGRISPLVVGSSGRTSDLENLLTSVVRVANDFIEMLESHFNQREFVGNPHKATYP